MKESFIPIWAISRQMLVSSTSSKVVHHALCLFVSVSLLISLLWCSTVLTIFGDFHIPWSEIKPFILHF